MTNGPVEFLWIRRTALIPLCYYDDYGWWAKLDAQGCRIVTRLKSNTPLAVIEEMPVAGDGPILSDRIGRLPARQGSGRKNPFDQAVREVRVELHTGKVLRVLSNDLEAPAEQIAALYKRRWAIELFARHRAATPFPSRSIGAPMEPDLNRTAVGHARP